MAVVPLFLADMATLKKRTKLSGLPSGSDGESMLEEGTRKVRANFIRRLGLTRVNQIVAFASTDTPSTENETLRLIAETTEVNWVLASIMRTLTTLFLDDSADALQTYHEEAPFRNTAPFERERELKRLEAEIEESLQLLEGTDNIGDETQGFKGHTFTPSTVPQAPGETVFPSNE